MGTTSSTKFIKNNAGSFQEQAALTTSAGVGDAQAIPALNASGVLDLSIVNGKVISAGAGDSGKLIALDGSGKIDVSVMPVGIGADTAQIVASEVLTSGDLLNIWNDAGTPKVRKADATVAGKEAMCFTLSSVSSGASATVYFEGSNTAVSGKTAGRQYLSTTAGTCSSVAPTSAGNVVQIVGFATSSTVVNFQSGIPITLA